jgi:Holliday junction DNA helicase RuvA
VRGDINTISKIRGLGKKTAERIVLELGDKVGVKDAWQAQSARATLAPQAAAKNDALLALISLGYKQVEAQKAIEKLPDQLSKPDEMLRAALRLLQG